MQRPDFSSLPKNPIRERREILGYNIAQLSRAVKITPQCIRDIEDGMAKNVPDKLRKFFEVKDVPNTIDVQYNDWRKAKRELVHLPPVDSLSVSYNLHPLTQYRIKISISIATFCKYLCIPRFVVMHYEAEQRRIPKQLKEVLLDAHLSQIDVARLANLGEIFYIAREQRKTDDWLQAHSQ